jgi:hypothetical protein
MSAPAELEMMPELCRQIVIGWVAYTRLDTRDHWRDCALGLDHSAMTAGALGFWALADDLRLLAGIAWGRAYP